MTAETTPRFTVGQRLSAEEWWDFLSRAQTTTLVQETDFGGERGTQTWDHVARRAHLVMTGGEIIIADERGFVRPDGGTWRVADVEADEALDVIATGMAASAFDEPTGDFTTGGAAHEVTAVEHRDGRELYVFTRVQDGGTVTTSVDADAVIWESHMLGADGTVLRTRLLSWGEPVDIEVPL